MSLFELAGFRDRTHAYGPPSSYEYREWQLAAGAKYAKKEEEAGGKPFNFLINAGVGSGKTDAAAGIGAFILNRKIADRIVYVCPNRMIITKVIETFKKFNIELLNWENGKRPQGEPVDMDGIAMTYASLNNNVEVQKRLCRRPTALFLDEIHHLGDSFTWCGAAKEAYEDRVRTVLGFTGTPWRTDNRLIPFVEFLPKRNGLLLYAADYTYSLGKAINDKVCRTPLFDFLDAQVEISDKGSRRVVSFPKPDEDDELDENLANRRLAGAIRRGTPTRTKALERMIQACKEDPREGFKKAVIFVGGNASNPNESGKKDALVYIPEELHAMGIPREKIVVVTSDDKRAKAKIRDFGKSDAWILVVIDMVSEGVDIPELRVELFLSTVTAKLKTIQRIGRVLRRRYTGLDYKPGEGIARIILFADPRYVAVAREIEKEIEFYRALILPDATVCEPRQGERRQRRYVEPMGLKAWEAFTGQHGFIHSHEEFEAVRERLEAAGLVADTDRVFAYFEFIDKGLLVDAEEALA